MTVTQLALWIALGVTSQLLLFLAVAFYRNLQRFQTLGRSDQTPEIAAASTPESAGTDAVTTKGWDGYRTFRVSRKVLEDEERQICSFYLVPVDALPLPTFKPGQYLTFKLELPEKTITRCYSLSDAPAPDHYRISVKRAVAPAGSQLPPGLSSGHFHDHIDVGAHLQVRAPAGHFYLQGGASPVVLIGGGVGITPMMSMLNWCSRNQPEREVWLFYGIRDAKEVAMVEHLQQLAQKFPRFQLHLCISGSSFVPVETGNTGSLHHIGSRIDMALLRHCLPLKPFHFYLCGPTAMLESLVPGLEHWGVPAERIHFETFGPSSIARKPPGPSPAAAAMSPESPVLVTFTRSGKTLEWQPGAGSLLEFAEAAGIAVDSGCRSGSCGSCQTRILTGEIRYLQTPDADPEPGACLMCVAAPRTAVSLEA